MVRKESRLQGKPLPRCIESGFVPCEEVDPEGMRKLMGEIMATAVPATGRQGIRASGLRSLPGSKTGIIPISSAVPRFAAV